MLGTLSSVLVRFFFQDILIFMQIIMSIKYYNLKMLIIISTAEILKYRKKCKKNHRINTIHG